MSTGGFGGGNKQIAHCAPTYAAVLSILAVGGAGIQEGEGQKVEEGDKGAGQAGSGGGVKVQKMAMDVDDEVMAEENAAVRAKAYEVGTWNSIEKEEEEEEELSWCCACPSSLPSSITILIVVVIIFQVVDRPSLYSWFLSLKDSVSGGFCMHKDGEVDIRGTYTVMAVAKLLNLLTPELTDKVGGWVGFVSAYLNV